MDQTTQQNAALVEEMAAAASSLKSQAQELVQTVAVFKMEGSRENQVQQSTIRSINAHSANPNAGGTGINLDNAIQTHADWRTKLRSAANKNEQVDADAIGRDDCCELGKWLHGAGRSKYGGKPSFATLIDGHRAFHTEAGKVARLINQGSGAAAEKLLDSGTPFARTSSEVGRLIVQFKKEISAPMRPTAHRATPKLMSPTASPISAAKGGDDDWETF
jgi:hypothetical protein